MPNTNDGLPSIRYRIKKSRRSRNGLIRFAKDITSQNGEDGIIRRIFDLLPFEAVRWCVDIGAWDGKHLSNTYSLLNNVDSLAEDEKNCPEWKGLLVEADAERVIDLRALYADNNKVVSVNQSISVAAASTKTFQETLDRRGPHIGLPDEFDFLCVDIDGSDYWVLQEMFRNGRYHPRVICIEFNPTMPDDLIYIPARSDTIRHGCSLAALVELTEANDYVLVETTLFNAFFVPRELYESHLRSEVPDTSIEALHEVTMGTDLYQLYDGTLKLSGCKKMLWHRLPLDEEKLQILPTTARNFPFAPPVKDSFDWSKIVDMSPFLVKADTTQARRQACQNELLAALKKDGFCFIRGTGIDPNLCQQALLCTDSLLHRADESVRRSCLAPDRARRGYSPMNTENFGSLLGSHEAPNDLVRKFRVGPIDVDETLSSSLLQPNVWPTGNNWDGSDRFQSTTELFYTEACKIANNVVEAICRGLVMNNPELSDSLGPLFESAVSDDSPKNSKQLHSSMTSILTLLSYRVGTRHKGKQKGPLVAAHTDVGLVTVLIFNAGDCAVLQRQDASGNWVDVRLPYNNSEDPVFVVNIADCLADLSGHSLPSTVHRVVACREGSMVRNGLALFAGLDAETRLTFPQNLSGNAGRAISYATWRKQRIDRAQKALQESSPCSFVP